MKNLLKKISRKDRNLTDEKLVKEYRHSEDLNIFAILFDRYTHLIYGICLKYLKNEEDSKDAVMQLFEEIAEKLKNHEVQNFKNWLYTVTKNHCLMSLRAKKSVMKIKEKIFLENRHEFMEFEDKMHLNENNDSYELKLKNALVKLKEEHRICIRLMYYEKKSYLEITEITGYSLSQVKSYIQNGKRNLKNIIIAGK